MIDNIACLVNVDAKLVRRGRFVDITFMIAIDDAYTLTRVQEGRIIKVTPGPFITPDFSFALRASRSVWEKFWLPLPPLGFTDVFALVKQKLMRVEGDIHPATSAAASTTSTSSAVRCSCSPANTTIRAPAKRPSTSPNAPARKPRS
jgi:hypothetical protein